MEAASSHSYVSKNFMDAYLKKKQKVQAKKEAPAKDVPKGFKEDEKHLATIVEEPSMLSSVSLKRRRSRSRSNSGSDEEQLGRCRSVESLFEGELGGRLNLSDCEDFDEPEMMMPAQFRAPVEKPLERAQGKKYAQEVDTNVFCLNMTTLKNASEIASGDPVFCKLCNAAFNIFSKIEEVKKDEGEPNQVWTCEFCNTKNDVSIEPEEIPKSKEVNYIVEAAAQVHDKKHAGATQNTIVFAIDISGSMCVSKQVVGKHSIKGDKTKSLMELMKFSDGSDQRIQGEANVTYISRMQCVQAAIDSQITEMAKTAPDRRLGIVTFNHEVTIIGDGSQDPQPIVGDKLYNYDYLIENGSTKGSQLLQKSIKETKNVLATKLMALEETGPTALGPGLASAIAIAAQGAPGSAVVLCTDGLANVGLGAFDEVKTHEQALETQVFYEKLGEYAKSKGVTVNIVSIVGEECNIDTLSRIAEITGGQVERVDPVQLTQNFANILQLPVIATNVVAKVKLHKGLEFRNEDPLNLSEDKSLMARELGNVTEETEITFEYRLKNIKELVKMEDIDLTQMKSFPFQAQISFNALDGSKCVRIISNQQDISNDRNALEKGANYGILSANVIQQSSKLAKKGQMVEAQVIAKTWKRRMREQITSEEQERDYANFNRNYADVYNMIQEEQHAEEEEGEPEEHKEPKKKKGIFRGLADKMSHGLFKASKMNRGQIKK